MIEAEIKAQIDRIPYARALGVLPSLVGEELTMILPFNPDNIGNPLLPALHGGAIGGFLEIAAITQLMFETENLIPPKPIGINVDYLRSGKPQDLYARAEVTKLGSRVANVNVRAWQKNYETPVAALHGHFLIADSKGDQ